MFAITPTKNTISGTITVTSSNPEIKLTAYYNSIANENKIGETQTARYGVNISLTDSRLNFNLDNVNTLDADNWTKEFLQLLEDGQSAEDACNELKEEYSGTGLDTVVICGNKSLCFN